MLALQSLNIPRHTQIEILKKMIVFLQTLVIYFSSFDIICYQETKVDEFDILSLPGFTAISQPRKQRHYRKSGGLAIFIKDNISQFCIQYKTESDYILWISIDKSVLDTDENVILGSIYIPPVQSRYYNKVELAVLEREIISQCSNNKYVFINGDLNGRSSHLPDFTLVTNLCVSERYINNYC